MPPAPSLSPRLSPRQYDDQAARSRLAGTRGTAIAPRKARVISPYRTIPERDVAAEKPAKRLPVFAIVLALMAAVRVVGALVTRESCGADAGLATIVMLVAGHALLAGR